MVSFICMFYIFLKLTQHMIPILKELRNCFYSHVPDDFNKYIFLLSVYAILKFKRFVDEQQATTCYTAYNEIDFMVVF